jgi:hypothetical protein
MDLSTKSKTASSRPREYFFLGGIHHGRVMPVVNSPEGYTLRTYAGLEIFVSDTLESQDILDIREMLRDI